MKFSWDIGWGSVSNHLRLIALENSISISEDSFRQIDSYNAHLHLKETPDQWLKRYRSYKDHSERFCGLCKVGEVIEAVLLQRNVLLLTKKWGGQAARKDHSDIEVWLKREVSLFSLSCICEIYNFGTLTVPKNSIENRMGEPAGSWRVSHLLMESEVRFNKRRKPTKIIFVRRKPNLFAEFAAE